LFGTNGQQNISHFSQLLQLELVKRFAPNNQGRPSRVLYANYRIITLYNITLYKVMTLYNVIFKTNLCLNCSPKWYWN